MAPKIKLMHFIDAESLTEFTEKKVLCYVLSVILCKTIVLVSK